MKCLALIIGLLIWRNSSAQEADSSKAILLRDVTVTSFREESVRATSLNILPIRVDSLSLYGNFNLTDLLAKTPGITMLTTGVAIAKPVIRGLYGNRILVLLSGLKFDNQQWQEEHGLGLSDIGLSRVELVKGPMSVLYGTEAMGGIINLIEEEKPSFMHRETDVGLKFNSNTLGGMLQGGYKANYGKTWFRIRVGIENNADYSDGNGDRVLNSRFDGYYLKGTYGFEKKNWSSVNNLMSSFNRFGFIFSDITLEPDDRWSRAFDENPAHLVLLNCLSSENKIRLKNSKLNLNLGLQSNRRMENEGSGKISLDMHLLTVQYLLKWEKQISEKNKLILSNLGSFEDNTNLGARKIVPDAYMQESNLAGYLETNIRNEIILENGIGVGEKWIKTFYTPSVNIPEGSVDNLGKEIHPFSKLSFYYNIYSGMSYIPNDRLNLKMNIATGVRIPNLAELSSDGLHEGIFTYEIGDPDLKNEQNLTINAYGNYRFGIFDLYFSPFYTHFYNYVYLSPTNEDWFGFPVYRYRQKDVNQAGGEITLTAEPWKNLKTSVSYSGMKSKTRDEENTPYIPAQKITPEVTRVFRKNEKRSYSFFVNADFCLEQNHTAPYEVSTPAYWLLNLGGAGTITTEKVNYVIALSVSNLLNEAYFDHLSRFKNYGLLNIGRNITLSVKMNFDSEIRKK